MMLSNNLSPTPEQSDILDFIRTQPHNLMIQAYAGCGKSATLGLIDAAIRTQPHLYLVFNKANAEKATSSFPASTTVKTFNSIGHRIWADFCSKKVSLNPKKIADIFRSIVDDYDKPDRIEAWLRYDQICAGVNLARSVGYIPDASAKAEKRLCEPSKFHHLLDEKPDDITCELINSILLLSIAQAYSGVIDFPDQCYMPALFGGFYPRYPVVLVDEYQDLSPVQHIMVEKLSKSARLIGVGDEAQSIYGFRGAKAGGMAQAIDKFAMQQRTLSVSFRCPSEIVKNVHWRVPNFQSARIGGTIQHSAGSVELLKQDSTVICRNNGPLIARAMTCLSQGISVNVSGTDISTRLLRTMTKLGDESLTKAQTLARIDDWLAERLANDSKSASDLAACMRVFAAKSPSLGAAIAYAKHMFEQSGTIQFMTGHKSKGLEFDHVYHLESDLCSSKGQDPNIRYVVDTRAREVLTYI